MSSFYKDYTISLAWQIIQVEFKGWIEKTPKTCTNWSVISAF